MLRAVLVVGLLLTLLIAAVFGPRLLRTVEPAAGTGAKTECDLDARACSWSDLDGNWHVELKQLMDQDAGYELTVTGVEAPDRLLAVLQGDSMYMGEYPVPFRRQGDGRYVARFSAPLCSTGSDMRWRLNLQRGQASIDTAPFHMVFQAHTL